IGFCALNLIVLVLLPQPILVRVYCFWLLGCFGSRCFFCFGLSCSGDLRVALVVGFVDWFLFVKFCFFC
ncbi:hypothetical protein RYX36_030153, partial [Vicia faba]